MAGSDRSPEVPSWPPPELVEGARELSSEVLMQQIVFGIFANGHNAIATMAAVVRLGSQEKEAAELASGPARTMAITDAAILALAERLAGKFGYQLVPREADHGQ